MKPGICERINEMILTSSLKMYFCFLNYLALIVYLKELKYSSKGKKSKDLNHHKSTVFTESRMLTKVKFNC